MLVLPVQSCYTGDTDSIGVLLPYWVHNTCGGVYLLSYTMDNEIKSICALEQPQTDLRAGDNQSQSHGPGSFGANTLYISIL